ncbi:MAG TPA: DUF4383 domain-containing protein [Amycolatopsis sp.]|nr:DUF4383 domain-containing protein [Amycolatopsis sp.]
MVHTQDARIRVAGLQPAQVLAAVVGVVFLVFGVIGFARTGFSNFTGHHVAEFWRFSANPMNNLVHVVTGLVGLLLAFGPARARVFGWLLFLGYGVLFVWGLTITGVVSARLFENAGNPLDLKNADNWLHLGIAVLGLVIAMVAARRVVSWPESAPGEGVDSSDESTRVMPAQRSSSRPPEEHGPGLTY